MTRKELLSEAAAWRKLAKWCADDERRTDLCIRLEEGEDDDRPDCMTWLNVPEGLPYKAMRPRLDGYYHENLNSEHRNDARVIFCLLMALECEQEARERLR